MARYNSALASASITGATTIGSPYSGAFTEFTGTAPYTVTLPNPALYPGTNQTFYNITGGTVTLSTTSGTFNGTGGTGTSTVSVYNGNVVSVTSDGTNYIVISEDGSALVATNATITGNVDMSGGLAAVTINPATLTMNPVGTSNMNNVAIGATTKASGAFTTLTANNAVTFTAGTSSTSTGTGTLVVTGGVGVSGTVTAATVNATNVGGTLTTAAQTNVTSVGTLSSLAVSGNQSVTGTLGIGDSSSYGKLTVHINGTTGVDNGPGTATRINDFNNATIVLHNQDTPGTGAKAGLFFAMAGSPGVAAGIAGYKESGTWNTGLQFYTNSTTGGSYTDVIQEKMRLTKDGNLGIGITNPGSKLDVRGAITSDVSIAYFINNHGTDRRSYIYIGSNPGTDWKIGKDLTNAGDNRFFIGDSGNSEKLVIATSGFVGLGTSTPQVKLDVNGNIIARGDLFIGTKPSNTLATAGSNTEWHHIGYAGGTNYHITGSVTGDLTLGAIPGTGIIFGTATNTGDAVPVQRARIAPNGAFSISNGLSVGAGASVGTSLDVGNGINFAAGYIRTAIYALNTYGGNGIIHMKTDQRTNNSNMYRFELVGYDYGSAQVLAGAWVGYLYSASDSAISLGTANWGNRAVCNSVYRSSDGYLVLVADIASYYCSFIIHFQAGATGTFTPTITSTYASTSTSAYF
jgi:hypothetical protein